MNFTPGTSKTKKANKRIKFLVNIFKKKRYFMIKTKIVSYINHKVSIND